MLHPLPVPPGASCQHQGWGQALPASILYLQGALWVEAGTLGRVLCLHEGVQCIFKAPCSCA